MAMHRFFLLSVSTFIATTVSLITLPALPTFAQNNSAFEQSLSRVLANPADPEASFRFAQIASQEGRFDDAIAALERVLILFPQLANIKLELGVLYLRVGQNRLAESFITDALNSPSVPPDVRQRAQELLATANDRNDPLIFSGIASFGFSYDSNANAGPESGVVPEDEGEDSASAFFRLGGELTYDLGFQAGHRLVGQAEYFGRRYDKTSDINLDRFSAGLGMLFNLQPTSELPTTLRLTFDAVKFDRDGESYLDEYGPTATLSFAYNASHFGQALVNWRRQDFKNTSTNRVNDLRDGEQLILGYSGRYVLSQTQSIRYGAFYSRKTAEIDSEAYDLFGVSLGYTILGPAPFNLSKRPWIYSIDGRYAWRNYDNCLPQVCDALGVEETDNYRVVLSARVPLENRFEVIGEIGTNGAVSTYEFREFDNNFVAVTLNRRF